ncbi:spore germination protein [Halobacillus salinarum]|uniref:Spore germination protein n=1 Tax=Halobacillus salinarum TaxID=2932257 RepID=A0ABY4EGJ6_9BACI|nr:GerAB/ArcD/ProY family transporter [Halobacillus salinarum]UOQ43598.1 spore germination protein [Halobacillus salinarum]
MNTNLTITNDTKIQAFYLFYVIHTVQIGAGLMGVPRIIFLEAGVDAWISIIIASIGLHIVAAVMLFVLKEYDNADILGIQEDVFGKWIGMFFSLMYLVYLFPTTLSVLKNYIEVVQVFVFPEMPTWLMSLALIFLIIYSLLGGIRVVVGVSFIFFIATIWLVFSLYKPISLMDFSHFTPIGLTNYKDILLGAYKTTFTVLGMEVLFFIYPYVKNKQNVKLPVHAGVFATNLLVLLVTVVSVGYFSPGQLQESVWATLSMFKIIHFSFIERFDVIAVSVWMVVVLPNMIILFWMMIRVLKRSFGAPDKWMMYVIGGLLFVTSILIEYRLDINKVTDVSARIGFWVVFVYPFIIYSALLLKKLFKRRRAK